MKKTFALMIAVVALLGQFAWADELEWQEGLHYHTITPVPQGRSGEAIEVTEFFWYGCPHCYEFEPFIKKWIETKPENVNFVRVPAMFGGAADLHARAYYALEVLGELERVHEPFFVAVQQQKRKLDTPASLEDWVGSQGVDVEKFRAAMDSFAVHAKVNRATALMRRYGVQSVPSMVVDGRYRNGRSFQDYAQLIQITEYLVDKAGNSQAATAVQ